MRHLTQLLFGDQEVVNPYDPRPRDVPVTVATVIILLLVLFVITLL